MVLLGWMGRQGSRAAPRSLRPLRLRKLHSGSNVCALRRESPAPPSATAPRGFGAPEWIRSRDSRNASRRLAAKGSHPRSKRAQAPTKLARPARFATRGSRDASRRVAAEGSHEWIRATDHLLRRPADGDENDPGGG